MGGTDEDNMEVSFVDDYGYSDVEKATIYFEKKRIDKKGASLSSEKRKYPFSEHECFIIDNQESPFDTDIVYDQLEHN